MPNPNPKEKQSDFVSRCMGDPEANKSFPDQKQRAAFCYSQYRRSKKRSKGSEPKWEEQAGNGFTIEF